MSALLLWGCHKKALVEVFFHAVIGLIPLSAVVVMLVYGKWEGWPFFWENGEFYIYSVVFLAMALYALFNLGLKENSLGNLLNTLIIVCLAVSLLLYGSLTYAKIFETSILPIPSALKISSLFLLGVSIFFFYVTTYWEKYREYIASRPDDRQAVEKIISQIHAV